MNKTLRYQNPFFFTILALVVTLCFFILRPYANTLLIASAFSVALYPAFRFIRSILKNRTISAGLTIVIALAIAALPVTFLVSRILTESQQAYATLGPDITNLHALLDRVQDPIKDILPTFELDIETYVRPFLQSLASQAGSIFSATLITILNAFITLLGVFFLLKNGHQIKRWLIELSPLPDEYDEQIFHRVEAMVGGVLRGSLLVAVIQGTLAGIGYAIFGVPSPTLWGMATAISALIPGIGTAMVMVPVVIYTFFTGSMLQAIGLAIWGAFAVGLIDNLVGPTIMGHGKDVNVHPFLILIFVLGGLQFFGIWGFILGPLVLSLGLALLDVYRELILPGSGTRRLKKRIVAKFSRSKTIKD